VSIRSLLRTDIIPILFNYRPQAGEYLVSTTRNEDAILSLLSHVDKIPCTPQAHDPCVKVGLWEGRLAAHTPAHTKWSERQLPRCNMLPTQRSTTSFLVGTLHGRGFDGAGEGNETTQRCNTAASVGLQEINLAESWTKIGETVVSLVDDAATATEP